MNLTQTWQSILVGIDEHWLLARLMFASLELAALALIAALAIRVVRPRTPRLVALVWALVLAKPLLTLAIGSPWHIVQVPRPDAQESGHAPRAVAELRTISDEPEMINASIGGRESADARSLELSSA